MASIFFLIFLLLSINSRWWNFENFVKIDLSVVSLYLFLTSLTSHLILRCPETELNWTELCRVSWERENRRVEWKNELFSTPDIYRTIPRAFHADLLFSLVNVTDYKQQRQFRYLQPYRASTLRRSCFSMENVPFMVLSSSFLRNLAI